MWLINRDFRPRSFKLTNSHTFHVFLLEDKDSTTTFERLALMIQYWITLIYSLLLFMTIIIRNSTRDGTKFHYQCQRFHPMMSWRVSHQHKKAVMELYDMEIHEKISMPDYQKLKTNGEEEKRSETSITKL